MFTRVHNSGACQMCGMPMPEAADRSGRPKEKRGGRRAMYCSRECRELFAAISTMQKWIGPVAQRATPTAWARLRGELWSWANMAPSFQREMAARSKARRAEAKALAGAAPPAMARGYVVKVGATVLTLGPVRTEPEAVALARAYSREHDALASVYTIAGARVAAYRGGKASGGKYADLTRRNPA